ncbi:MAG: DUF4406 domain-containing protein [Candidatus Nanohaloarchaea archaeon]|nr:DUF4406 domain-containing protein [Candidatus Nanohaloarchaea archaeon]
MKHVYFAGPVSVDPDTATTEKKRFLREHWDVLEEQDINVYSPHMMYLWLTEAPENTGKGSPPEEYALNSCLNLLERVDLDAVIMLTPEGRESSGMQKEKELAQELGIPIHHFPYFDVQDDELVVHGTDAEEFRSFLSGLDLE